jgi:hypothetical protein
LQIAKSFPFLSRNGKAANVVFNRKFVSRENPLRGKIHFDSKLVLRDLNDASFDPS